MASKKDRGPEKTSRKSIRKVSAPLAFRTNDSNGKSTSDGRSDSGSNKLVQSNKPAESNKPVESSKPAEVSKPVEAKPAERVEPEVKPAEESPPPAKAPMFAEILPPRYVESLGVDANADAPPPGRAPRGDSRSFRRLGESGPEFCLIYRFENWMVERRGPVGKEGTWTFTEYPTISNAAHAYAQRSSELGAEGFRDFRG